MYIHSIKLMYWQLLLYGVHIGHSFSNSVIFSSWFVYTYRQNLLIINLFKTILMLKNGYVGLSGACHLGGPIWFINLHRSVELFMNYSAKQCGEFCYTTYWVHGLISNWITLANTFKKLNRAAKTSNKGQFAKLELSSSPWVMGRFSWPRATFVSSVSTSPHPTKESLYLGIPCLGIVDTDVSGHIANMAIPGNDDSLDCLVFYNTHISQYILEKKYGNISGWFFHVRRHKRVITFVDWVFNNYLSKDGSINVTEILDERRKVEESLGTFKSFVKYKAPYNTIWTYGLEFFFSRNHGLTNFKEQVDLYEPEESIADIDVNKLLLDHRWESVYISKIINHYILKASWRFGRFLKKHLFRREWFKRRFLVGFYEKHTPWDVTNSKNYMKARFYVNRVYKTHLRRNKWRFNKLMLRFLKFYLARKYMKVRGFLKPYISNVIHSTSFAHVAESFGSKLFPEFLYPALIKDNKKWSLFKLKKKKDLFVKWHFFRKAVAQKVVGLLNKRAIPNLAKISLKWKVGALFSKLLYKKTELFYIHYVAFFNFYLWNKAALRNNIKEYSSNYYKEWRVLKNIQRNYIYMDFLKEAIKSYKTFQGWLDNPRLGDSGLIYYFKLLTQNYRKAFFFNVDDLKIEALTRVPRYFKSICKKNTRKRVWVGKKLMWRRYKKLYLVKGKLYGKWRPKSKLTKIYYRTIRPAKHLVRYLGDKRFRYKRNKYLRGQKGRFVTFGKFMNEMVGSKGMRKIRYNYRRVWNLVDLRFVNAPLANPNQVRSSERRSRRVSVKSLRPLSFKGYSGFIDDYTISAYGFKALSYRYHYPSFYGWKRFKDEDDLKENAYASALLKDQQTKGRHTSLTKGLAHLRMRIRLRQVDARHKVSIRGMENYLLIGDKELPMLFSRKYWAYLKQIFGYPSTFYFNQKAKGRKIYWQARPERLTSKPTAQSLKYLFFFIKIISVFNKHFNSKVKGGSIGLKFYGRERRCGASRMYWG